MSDRVQEDEAGQAGRSDHLHSCSIGSSSRDIIDPVFILQDGRKVRNRVEVMRMIRSDKGEVNISGEEAALCADLACMIRALRDALSIWKIMKYVFIGLTYRGGDEDEGE